MSTSFLTKKTIFGIIALLILMAGLAGGVYLSQQQTQVKSRANEACTATDYGPVGGTPEWCACAASFSNWGALVQYNCSQVQCSNLVTSSVCGGTIPSFDNCTSTCEDGRKVYNCQSSRNPNCVNNGIICSSETCGAALPVPVTPPAGGSTCTSTNFGDPNNKVAWCACALSQGDTGSYNRGPKTDGSDPCRVCTPGAWSASQCAACKSDGSGYNTIKDYGPNENSPEWCNCAKSAPDYATSPTYATCRGAAPAGAPANPDDGSKCLATPEFLDVKTSQRPVPYYLLENTEYYIKMVMENTGKSTWKSGSYIFKPSELTKLTWQVPDVVLDQDVPPGGQKIFKVRAKTPATSNGEAKTVGLFYQMTNNNVGFAAACEPQEITITSKPAAEEAPGEPTPGETTACFVMSESFTDVSAVTVCDNPEAVAKGIIKQYTSDPTTVPYTLQDDIVGIKTVYVRFISTTGTVKDINKQIRFSPDPVLDVVACTHSATGQGTLIGIRGQNFGAHRQQGAGYVKVGDQNATITSWNESTNVIIANVPTRLEGEQTVELKLDDGRSVLGKCSVGISNVQFSVNTQCTLPGSWNASNVDVRIQEATSGAKPILSKKIKINKGLPADFEPTIETGKKYSLIIKGPETLAKKVDFVADEGTKNLGEIKLWIGDIAPRVAPDGKINTLDKSEMSKQWSLLETTNVRSADLNKDGTVNSHDYSCQKLGFNQQDEVTITQSQSN